MERLVKPALWRGWKMKCPNCGTGAMMQSYLRTNQTCPHCGEELFHHRADDGPAYMTILVAGHILAPLIIYIFTRYDPNPLLTALVLSGLFVALALFLLPRFKGMFVALQWAKRMYGFSDN